MAEVEGEIKPERPQSLRRRLTSSIKRVMSIRSKKSDSQTSSPSVVGTPVSAPASSTPVSPAPVESPKAVASMSVVPAPPIQSARSYQSPTYKSPTYKSPVSKSPAFPSNAAPVLMVAERAQALFSKYGVDIKTSDWPIPAHPKLELVCKEIRMRVHRTCHKCKTTYGSDKHCVKCGHRRCRACPRYPLKKHKSKDKERERERGKGKETTKPLPGYKKRRGDCTYGLTMPNRRGGPELVHKEIRQRVHRTCHRCHKDFSRDKLCSNCNHTRCKKCPRVPNRCDKPLEYHNRHDPDDSDCEISPPPPRRTYKRPRRRVHWSCAKCHSPFIEKCKICPGCGSNRSDTGIRDPPKKTKNPYHHPHHRRFGYGYSSDEDLHDIDDRLRLTTLSDR